MDLISTTTNGQNTGKSRDVGAHRRVYLDTYARRRAGLSDKPAEQEQVLPVEATQVAEPVAVMPMYNPAASLKNVQEQVVAAPVVAHTVSQLVAQNIPKQQAAAPVQQPVPQQMVQQAPVVTSPQPMQTYAPAPQQQQNYVQPAPVAQQQTAVQFQATAPVAENVLPARQPQEDRSGADERIAVNLRALYADEDSLTAALMNNQSSASLSHMRTIVASAFACGIIAVSLFSFFGQAGSQPVIAQPVGSPVIEVEAPPVRQVPQATPAAQVNSRVAVNPNHPVRIVMGGIGVNAPVEGVGTTPAGLMEVPQSYGVVGWYNKGAMPGDKGPAVLAGHFTGGYGGVFDKLTDVKDGDLITMTNGKGENFTYKVTKKVEYEKDKVPMAELFKPSNESRLEIIPCSGKWQAQNYDKRLVVTAEIVR